MICFVSWKKTQLVLMRSLLFTCRGWMAAQRSQRALFRPWRSVQMTKETHRDLCLHPQELMEWLYRPRCQHLILSMEFLWLFLCWLLLWISQQVSRWCLYPTWISNGERKCNVDITIYFVDKFVSVFSALQKFLCA